MLALRRHLGQSILIGPDVLVTVTKVENNEVTLSIHAPRTIPIVRSELTDPERILRVKHSDPRITSK